MEAAISTSWSSDSHDVGPARSTRHAKPARTRSWWCRCDEGVAVRRPDSPSCDVGSIGGKRTPRSSWSASGSCPSGSFPGTAERCRSVCGAPGSKVPLSGGAAGRAERSRHCPASGELCSVGRLRSRGERHHERRRARRAPGHRRPPGCDLSQGIAGRSRTGQPAQEQSADGLEFAGRGRRSPPIRWRARGSGSGRSRAERHARRERRRPAANSPEAIPSVTIRATWSARWSMCAATTSREARVSSWKHANSSGSPVAIPGLVVASSTSQSCRRR